MKLRLAAGAAVAAATLAIPAVAHAATYAPFSATDPAGDVSSNQVQRGIGTSYPEIDMTSVRGARSSVQHSIAVKFVGLEKTPYTRYAIALQAPDNYRTRILEVRVGGGGTVNTAFYTVKVGDESTPTTIQQTYCSGARIVPDFEKDKITAVFPQKCFVNAFPLGVYVYAQTGEWSARSWTSGPLTTENDGTDADASDDFYGIWDYAEGALTPSQSGKSGFPGAARLPKLY